uniref:Multi-CRP-I 5 n=1 Tax=Mytilus galloprovincialis TaxID=29158 RepID=A0A0A7ACV9_MYTGA|nr:multi-CRP-I 5 [Mytilus galloprovincialis]
MQVPFRVVVCILVMSVEVNQANEIMLKYSGLSKTLMKRAVICGTEFCTSYKPCCNGNACLGGRCNNCAGNSCKITRDCCLHHVCSYRICMLRRKTNGGLTHPV